MIPSAVPVALVAVAVAALLWPAPGRLLLRVVEPPARNREPRWLRPRARVDPFDVAAGYDLFAVCLQAGLPVPDAALVTAPHCPAGLGTPLRRAGDLLALGADPVRAWTVAAQEHTDRGFSELAALARRAAASGSGLADAVAALARATRERAENQATERAERAGVKISGPLGLCFLPAFVVLGIVPVVIGLAGGMLHQL
ncbi:type II secretion system F family protein [Gordonia sp. VNK21]|uniref:type II secretion system F family protein n=1 Tax=Gordonia sp. VNK21 TaxID=3382483 RepID=UPI0038D361C9